MWTEHTELIGVGGLAGAGKDTYAEIMQELYPDRGYVIIGMSDTLRDAIMALNPIVEISEGRYYSVMALMESFVTEAHLSWNQAYTELKKIPGVRTFLQKLGTEVGREMISENVWVDATLKKITELREVGYSVILTGVRFQNELDMVHNENGRSVFIINENTAKVNTHSSETSISPEDFGTIIHNNGSIEDLKNLISI